MGPKRTVAFAAVTIASVALSAAPAMAICNIGGVERAGPSSVWIYFVGPPARVNLTHAGVTRVVSVTPPPLQGDQQVRRPAVLAQLGDRLHIDNPRCDMRVSLKWGRLGVRAQLDTPPFPAPGTGRRNSDAGVWASNPELFYPARPPQTTLRR